MGLSVFRRHRRDCKAGHPEDHFSSEFDERKKGWKRCECPIAAAGTLAGKYRRQSTGKWEWEDAKAVVAVWVNPAKTALALMTIQAPSPEWIHWRNQWEYTHFARFCLQALAFAMLTISVLGETPEA
jgi:hypothetical protein